MSLPVKPKPQAPTAAQLAVLHVAESAGLSALVALLLTIVQYISTNGNLNITMLLSALGGGFLTGLAMIYKSVSTNPNLLQAIRDTLREVLQEGQQMVPADTWLTQDVNKFQSALQQQRPAPQPILFPPAQQPKPVQQQSGGGGVPADYYTRNYNVQTRASVADMSTQGYPAVQPSQPQSYPGSVQTTQFTNTNQVPPAMSFLQQNQPQSAIEQLRNTQQGG